MQVARCACVELMLLGHCKARLIRPVQSIFLRTLAPFVRENSLLSTVHKILKVASWSFRWPANRLIG